MNAAAAEEIVEAKPSTRSKKKAQPKLTAYRFILAAFGGYALASFAAMLIAQYFSEEQSNWCKNKVSK